MNTKVFIAILLCLVLIYGVVWFKPLTAKWRRTADVPVAATPTDFFSIVFVRGSGSTWLMSLLNQLDSPHNVFCTLNEPQQPILRAIASKTKLKNQNCTAPFVGSKSKILHYPSDLLADMASCAYRPKLVWLHRRDVFAHVIGVARKKMSPNGNAVSWQSSELTGTADIDAALFRGVAREIVASVHRMRAVMIERASRDCAQTALSVTYERLLAEPVSELARVAHFLSGGQTFTARALQTVVDSGRHPLKNTNAKLGDSVTNLLELAKIANDEFPLLRDSIPPPLLAKLASMRVAAKNATLQHKTERKKFYDDKNARAGEKFFNACSAPPKNAKRTRWHCQLRDFLQAGRGQASPASITEFFGNIRMKKNPALCTAFAMGLSIVANYNSTSDTFVLKSHLRW